MTDPRLCSIVDLLAGFHHDSARRDDGYGAAFITAERDVYGTVRCFGFSGQSNSLFFKEKEGRSDAQHEAKDED